MGILIKLLLAASSIFFGMKKLIFKTVLLITLIPISVHPETWISPHCPSTVELNRTTEYAFKSTIEIAISHESYTDNFIELGITKPLAYDDLRLLQTETDSAVCQKLNERFENLDSRFVYDRELRKYMPALFVLYFEIQGRYIVIRKNYSPGEADGSIGLPTMGITLVSAYDKSNLNFIGSTTL